MREPEMKIEIKEFAIGTELYEESLELRNRMLRDPLGMRFCERDLLWEENARFLGAFEDRVMIGVCAFFPHGKEIVELEHFCVDGSVQKKGVGRLLIGAMEEVCRRDGFAKIVLEARHYAEGFYRKCGYVTVSEPYMHRVVPIEHVRMEKEL